LNFSIHDVWKIKAIKASAKPNHVCASVVTLLSVILVIF